MTHPAIPRIPRTWSIALAATAVLVACSIPVEPTAADRGNAAPLARSSRGGSWQPPTPVPDSVGIPTMPPGVVAPAP